MGQLTIDALLPGDDRTVTKPNNTLTSWRTQSTAINSANIREGGIDRRNLASEAAIEQPTVADVFSTDAAGTASAAGASQWVISGNNVEIGPFVYDSAADPEIEVLLSFQYTGTAPTSPNPNNTYHFQLYYSTGGSTVAISSTHRKAAGGSYDVPITGSLTIRHRFVVSTGSVSDLKFHLYCWESTGGGAQLTVEDVYFTAKIYNR